MVTEIQMRHGYENMEVVNFLDRKSLGESLLERG